MTGPAIDKVADSTIQEAKKLLITNNLDDLNDIAKQFYSVITNEVYYI